jgi:hypothetical protein
VHRESGVKNFKFYYSSQTQSGDFHSFYETRDYTTATTNVNILHWLRRGRKIYKHFRRQPKNALSWIEVRVEKENRFLFVVVRMSHPTDFSPVFHHHATNILFFLRNVLMSWILTDKLWRLTSLTRKLFRFSLSNCHAKSLGGKQFLEMCLLWGKIGSKHAVHDVFCHESWGEVKLRRSELNCGKCQVKMEINRKENWIKEKSLCIEFFEVDAWTVKFVVLLIYLYQCLSTFFGSR